MFDLTFDFGSFATTEVAVSAATDAGKAFLASVFGAGAVGINLPKSKADDFYRFCQQKGLRV